MTYLRQIAVFCCFLAIFTFLNACGGDAGGGTSSNPPSQDGNINGGLSGKLFMGADGKILDISTGKYSSIPGVDWEGARNNNYLSGVEFTAFSGFDGTTFLVTVDRCAEASDTSSYNYRLLHDDCLEIRNSDGQLVGETSRGQMMSHIKEGAKLSRDGNYLAFFYNDDRLASPNDELYIFDTSFNLVRQADMPVKYGRSFDWTNNGEIVYSTDQTLYITQPYELTGTPIASFKNEMDDIYPFPTHIAVSPDGTKIAFVLVYSSSGLQTTSIGDIWIMNIDGSDLHRLVHVDESDGSPYMISPTWSPDGQYILFMDGSTSSVHVASTGTIYAAPSDSRDISINETGAGGVQPIRTYFKGEDNDLTYDASSYGQWTWLQ
jgi:hypothetical protein